MRILFLTKILPYPLDSGVKIKTYKVLRLLCNKHKIHLVSFVTKKEELDGEKHLLKLGLTLKTFVKPIYSKFNNRIILKLFYSLILFKPYIIYKFKFNDSSDYIDDFLKKNDIDLIYIDNIHMAQYIPNWFKGKLVYDEHEILYETYSTFCEVEKNIIIKLFFLLESKKLEHFEREWLPKFNHIFTISKLDRISISKMSINNSRISFLPIPFETKNLYKPINNKKLITFVGTLSWFPNIKGIEWFINSVYPLIKTKIPEIKLLIAGNNGRNTFYKHSTNSSILYVGRIKNLTTLYKKTSVFIIPIFSGGGIRIKLLEVSSYGIPIVSTTKGAEGVEVRNCKEILIANTPFDFAEAIIKIITNKTLASQLSRNEIRLIEKNYNKKQTEKILRIIE